MTALVPYFDCPRFAECSANVCRLDPQAHVRVTLAGEEVCRALRGTREAIARRHPDLLPGGGLLPRDVRRDRARARWAALPPDEKARRLARLALCRETNAGIPPARGTRNDAEG